MSTLKLKGSTSGYVELTAPATAGDNQIVLPTTAGTVAVKDASGNTEVGTGVTIGSPSSNVFTVSTNGSERLRVDSSGNINVDSGGVYYDATNNRLAVGTTSPSRQLQVQNLAGSTIASLISTTSGNCYLFLGDTASDGPGRIGYLNSEDALTFWSNAGERGRFDSSGRLLVGTSTSTKNIVDDDKQAIVYTGNAGQGGLSVTGYSGTSFPTEAAPRVNLQRSRGTTDGTMTVVASGDLLGKIDFRGADGTNFIQAAKISAFVDGTPGTDDMPGRLVFSTTADGASSPTERMRISSDGQTYWSASAPSASSFGTSIGRLALGLVETFRNINGTSSVVVAGGTAGYARIMGDGDLENTNNRYTAISDIKYKQKIEDASSQWDDIKAIQVRKYELIANPDRKHIGVIAQELEQVCPGLVIERNEDDEGIETYKSVAYSVLYMKAVKALQEAMERIETLEVENATLKSDFTALATRVDALESA